MARLDKSQKLSIIIPTWNRKTFPPGKLKYSNKIGIEDQGFNGNQVNKKMSNWRNLKIFNFIM